MDKEKEKQEEALKEFVEKEEGIKDTQVGPKITTPASNKMPWQKEKHPLADRIGWIPIKLEDLPTQGLFYPKDTKISIRSATGAEIRHWSTLQEDDFSALDDMLNYVIEKCCTIKSSDPNGANMSWKDIKEVDRFYVILAIQELTFPEGENKLQVKVSDTKRIDVRKDMINYITLDPKLMKYYDEEERCFVLKFKSGKALKIDLPSVGVTQWLKHYIIRKQQGREQLDEDFLSYAPFVIRNWRGLNDENYHRIVVDSHSWDITTLSLLVHVKKLFADAVDPVIRYFDEGGVEQVAPINFQGGIKSLFIISDPFAELE